MYLCIYYTYNKIKHIWSHQSWKIQTKRRKRAPEKAKIKNKFGKNKVVKKKPQQEKELQTNKKKKKKKKSERATCS